MAWGKAIPSFTPKDCKKSWNHFSDCEVKTKKSKITSFPFEIVRPYILSLQRPENRPGEKHDTSSPYNLSSSPENIDDMFIKQQSKGIQCDKVYKWISEIWKEEQGRDTMKMLLCVKKHFHAGRKQILVPQKWIRDHLVFRCNTQKKTWSIPVKI